MRDSVIMFHIGRSGSRVVGQLLDQHPQIDWPGEALKRRSVDAFRATLADPDRYDTFSHLRSLSDGRSAAWLGVEVKFFHLAQRELALAEFVGRVAEMGCERFVVLRRRNMLRKIVSSLVAKETKSYHRGSGESASLTQIRIDPDRVEIDAESKPLRAFLGDYQQGFDQLDGILSGRPVLSLSYEDDISSDPRVAYRKVCAFLGVEAADPVVPFGKTNPFPLREIVTNLDEVRDDLAGTPFAWMADEAGE